MTPRAWRTENNLTIADISAKTGLSEGYISEIERGLKEGSLKVIKAYHRISGGKVSFNDFPVTPTTEAAQ